MINLSDAINNTNKMVADTLLSATPGLNEMTAHLTNSIGKGIRTRLLLLSSMNEDGNVPENSVKLSAAIELLHMATLVHDDVIDDSPLRRGIETVQNKFGKKRAVICGDYLLCLSLSILTNLEQTNEAESYKHLAARFSKALSGICRGEYNQYQNNANINLDILTYLKIISGKTAALFYISAYSGALAGGHDEKTSRNIGRFGKYLGMIFQIIDDCKDYEFNETQAQKSVGRDIVEGIVTLPLIMAIKKDPQIRALAKDAIGNIMNAPLLITEVLRLDGANDARNIASKYREKAIHALNDVNGLKKEKLLLLLENAMGASAKF